MIKSLQKIALLTIALLLVACDPQKEVTAVDLGKPEQPAELMVDPAPLPSVNGNELRDKEEALVKTRKLYVNETDRFRRLQERVR